MSETKSIVGIFGAIDRAVQTDAAARARVAEFLRPYRNPTVKWYDEFQEWIAGPGEESDSDFPDIVGALTELGQTGVEGRTRARRMFAIAVMTRAFPDRGDLRELAILALRAPEETRARAEPVDQEALYKLLAGEDVAKPAVAPGSGDWWNGLIATAVARKVIPDKIGMVPQPCSGRLLTVPGVTGPVAVLKTEATTAKKELEFDKAIRFIEPVNWKKCMPDFWCDMHENPGYTLPPGQRRYHEIVSTHCDDKGQLGFWAETELLFDFMWLPNKAEARAAVANYELAPERPQPGDRILVDEGTLLVEKLDNGAKPPLKITTTKRVKFNYPFMTEALALVICALGYADTSGSLLCCAARSGKDFTGTDFPGVAPTAHPQPSAAGAAGTPSGRGQMLGGGLVEDACDIWARSLRDWASAIERGGGGAGPARAKNTRARRD
jgi:hypothetical protein